MIKKYKIRAYIFLAIFLILVIGFGIYNVMATSKNNDKNKLSEKTENEIKYLDENLIKIFNQMNNIKYESYKISVNTANPSNMEEGTNQSNQKGSGSSGNTSESGTSSGKSDESTKSSESNNSGGKSGSNKGESSKNQSSNETSGSDSSSSETGQKKYELQEEGILTQSLDIDWQTVKNDVEKMYLSIPTITLDLYQTTINDQNILNFNTEFDNLTKIVQKENKVETLRQLCKIYEIYVKFLEENNSSEQEKVVAKTKLDIFKAYSSLDDNNWEEISNYMKSASEEFSKLMTSLDMKEQKQYSINKSYIMINELYKATNIKDPKIFLIKYKNTLEELKNI